MGNSVRAQSKGWNSRWAAQNHRLVGNEVVILRLGKVYLGGARRRVLGPSRAQIQLRVKLGESRRVAVGTNQARCENIDKGFAGVHPAGRLTVVRDGDFCCGRCGGDGVYFKNRCAIAGRRVCGSERPFLDVVGSE